MKRSVSKGDKPVVYDNIVNLIPVGQDGMTFDAWKQAIVVETGRPLNNPTWRAVKKQGLVIPFLVAGGELRVRRGGE